jgi:hypothetical protein
MCVHKFILYVLYSIEIIHNIMYLYIEAVYMYML